MYPVLLFPEEGIELLKEMSMRESIVIIGGGLMGSGIAAVSALAGILLLLWMWTGIRQRGV